MTQKRYPGASPFTSEQQHIFFGRDKDIDKLYKLILLRNQVLLYSKSGIGKTSLLNAGVMPRFEKKFLVVNIRFTAYNEDSFQTPVKRVIESVKNAVPDFNLFEAPDLERIVISGDIDNSFWLLFKKLQMSERIDRKIILVFDQFEELFTYPDHLVAEFATQLYELTRVDIPDTLMLEMAVKIDDSEQRSDLLSTFSEDMGVKTVFAIRSDRLSLLNKLSDKIRDIQETFYELAPLTIEQVTDAVVQPAKKQTAGFETQPFEYTQAALDKILNELSEDRKQSIDNTQLQIVCQQIEEIAKTKQGQTLDKATTKIEMDDLPKFDAIFYDFYDKAVLQLPQDQQKKARELIEDQLIRNQQRISLDMNICYDYIGKPALDTLVSVHLLRAEPNTTGGTSYELAHDTLVAPILEARKVRLEKMEEERAEQERQKELRLAQEKAEHERMERDKERKRQRKILFIISVAAVVSIALGVFALIKMNQANALLNQLSEKQKQEQKLKYERFSSEAKSAQENGNFEKAIDLWQVTKEFTADTLTINATIDSCKALIGKGKEFEEIVKQAKALVSESRYDAAIDAYKKALDLGVSNQTVINQLKDLKIEIDNQASEHRNRAEALKTFNPAGAATERNMAAKFENLSGRIVKLI